MILLALWLGCASDARVETEAPPPAPGGSRAASDALPSPATGGVAPLVHPWSRETAAGECLVYSEDGGLAQRIVTTAEGRPLLVDRGNIRQQWYRARRPDGTVATLWVYSRNLAGPDGLHLVAYEQYDDEGRLISRGSPTQAVYTWTYDEQGRLLSSEGPEYRTRYAYADGLIVLRETWGVESGYADTRYSWDGGRLASTWYSDDHGNSGTEWTSHTSGGLPSAGYSWSNTSGTGTGPRTEITRTYDDDGHSLEQVEGARRTRWEWDEGRVVVEERVSVDASGNERVRRTDWAWDDQGRLVFGDDGEHVRTWTWDEGQDLAEYTFDEHVSQFVGDCPLRVLQQGLLEDPTPRLLPEPPALPAAFGESGW
jgi:YD repeat-containing protein